MSFCQDCIKGVQHSGTPAGKIEYIDGIECYVATPTVDYPKDKVILLLTDVFGLSLNNNKLLADSFAANGFKTVMPDLFRGDPVPADAVLTADADAAKKEHFDIYKWFGGKDQADKPKRPPLNEGHSQAVTQPIIDNVIAKLQEEGVKHFAAVGYCFGGRYVFDLALKEKKVISVAAVAHPSLLDYKDYKDDTKDDYDPERANDLNDLQKYVAQSQVPLLINSCEVDEMFPIEAQAKADEIFETFKHGYKREYFKGCSHGFAVRGKQDDETSEAAREGAFKATVEWFKKYL
ncbi:dienelactone hydrolase endo-1,3,1,4-beta-D-glucanase [Mycena polygramma]|nr:dienelactone hydrolase endo-1,3,1,4-beta-D-glucanase [Mycena polygramma]